MTTKQNHNKMKNLKTTIESILKYEKKKMNETIEKLNENYVSNFGWYGEEAFRLSYKVQQLTRIIDDMKLDDVEDSDFELVVVKRYINSYETFIKTSYNVRVNSTGSLHREVSTWTYQTNLDLLNFLEQMIAIK